MNPKLPQWVQASLAIIMKAVAETLSVGFFVEGIDEETPAAFQSNSILLRVNGPSVIRSQSDAYSIQVQVVLTDLVTPKKNSYEHFLRCGTVASTLEGALPINRHGDGGELIGCLTPDRSSREIVKIIHFGQVDETVKVRQSAVIANFELCL